MKSDAVIVAEEEARAVAIVAADLRALEACLDDTLVFVHSSGLEDTKAEFVARAASGQYVGWRQANLRVTLHGDVAVVLGERSVDVGGDAPRTARSRFVDVWVNRDGRWRNTLSQSTPLT